MSRELYHLSSTACLEVYNNNVDLGTTEYRFFYALLNGEMIQVLAIAGSNELRDWFINVNLLSWKGIKYGAYKSAKEINKNINIDAKMKLLVCGHSKAGSTAIAFKRLFGADYCVAFAPARSLRYWINRKMNNTTLFIDPDDPVSKVGFINFGHPDCKIIEAKDDHIGLSISDHFMENWVEFTKNYKESKREN